MGIYDREYYRDTRSTPGGPPALVRQTVRAWSVNTWIIAINIAVFVLGSLFLQHAGVPVMIKRTMLVPWSQVQDPVIDALPTQDPRLRQVGAVLTQKIVDRTTGKIVGTQTYQVMDPLAAYGHFSTYEGFTRLQVWRLVTFQFLHANFMHIFFNLFGLWIFGGMVEQYLGRRKYLAFYLAGGIFGGLSYLLLNFLGAVVQLKVPGVLFNDPHTPLVGASAGVFAVIMASAYIAPNAKIMLLIPPIPMPLKVFAYGYVGVALLNLLMGGANAGGDAAHIGGAIAGAFFIRKHHLLHDFFDIFNDSRHEPDARPRRKPRAAVQRDIDRILAKVATEGLASLSEAEKETLRRATEAQRSGRL